MEGLLLKDQNVYPDKEVLKKALGGSYPAYEELLKVIAASEYSLVPEWRYYNDGKAWLCKVCHKKKTVFWLSIWDKYFKTSFYFTEKTGSGIASLRIDAGIKKSFIGSKHTGKLIPLTIEMRTKNQLTDLLKIISYKMKI
jgi:hypothetical protein